MKITPLQANFLLYALDSYLRIGETGIVRFGAYGLSIEDLQTLRDRLFAHHEHPEEKDISAETFVVDNTDGSVSLDPYAGQTRTELKIRCGELCGALDKWQWIAMGLSEGGRESLTEEQRKKLDTLIEAYLD